MSYDTDALPVDGIDLAVPQYDKEPDELFSGPGYPGFSEYNDEEFYEEDDDEDPELDTPALAPSVATGIGTYGPAQTGILRDYTQFLGSGKILRVHDLIHGGYEGKGVSRVHLEVGPKSPGH